MMIFLFGVLIFAGTWILGYEYGKDYGYRKGWDDAIKEADEVYRELEIKYVEEIQNGRTKVSNQ